MVQFFVVSLYLHTISIFSTFDFVDFTDFLTLLSRQPGLNRRPARYECAALPTELCRHTKYYQTCSILSKDTGTVN